MSLYLYSLVLHLSTHFSMCFFLPYHHFLCFLIAQFFFLILSCSRLQNGVGDANDIWKIMVFGGRENETILTVTSKLVFIHYLQHCALTASGQQLPKWGFEQQEVSCNPNLRDKNAHWNIEDNVFAKCMTTLQFHYSYCLVLFCLCVC